MSETLLDQIERALQDAATYNENAEVAPVVLLWPDRDRDFSAAVARLRDRIPILTLGDFEENESRGPAYWLRCAIAGTVDFALPDPRVGQPIVYLPDVGREDLRAVESCPCELAPIAELQYRGQWFSHPNGKDWTIRGFLSNRTHGLGLAVAEDAATTDALRDSFDKLLDLPMTRMTAGYIDAEFLQRLLNPDLIGALLDWLDDPTGYGARLDEGRWKAFVEQSRREFDFDPSSEGELTGGRLLGEQKGCWQEVWDRFVQAPERYQGVETRLRKGRPIDMFADPPGAWPQDNEDAERSLRSQLVELAGKPAGEARSSISELWQQHRQRRGWVWARLGRAPLVFALEHLDRLSDLTAHGPQGDVDGLVESYARDGWEADNAVLAALAAVEDADGRNAVAVAGAALYLPWVEVHAQTLQEAIGPLANAGTYEAGSEASTSSGTVTVFVDGLRLDLAHRLASRMGGLETELDTVLAALPTVTQTAKPALTPVPDGSLVAGKDLGPARVTSGAKASIAVLRGLMGERDVQVLQGSETGDPAGCAWTEIGDIDSRGHQFGVALVDEIDGELDRIARRVSLLLDAGWEQVDVVTDHGWLLLPGGLGKVDLPAATTHLKKGRCARLKDGANVAVPTVPWYWSQDVRIGLAPGITCFEAGKEFEHGGVSLQECVVPRLRIRAAEARVATGGATVTRVKWLGLMCRIDFENVAPGASVDIRALPGDDSTSVVEDIKVTSSAGRASLFITDEELEGEEAYIVIIASDGSIVAQREVTIGSNR